MGCMITYGSYLPERENMPFAGVAVAFFDTIIAVLAGLIGLAVACIRDRHPQGTRDH